MNFAFELCVIKYKGLAFLKIESYSEEFYRKIINIIDQSYKKYNRIIFKATSKGSIVVIQIHTKYLMDKNSKMANSIEDIVDENAKDFIKEIFDNQEQLKIFFKKLSKNNQI